MVRRSAVLFAGAALTMAGSVIGSGVADGSDPPGLPHAFEAGWRGDDTCEVLYVTAEVRVGRCVFPPGVGHEEHFHHPHFGYVIEGGVLEVSDDRGTQTVTTNTGDTWSTDSVTVHEAINIGRTTTRYIIVEPIPGGDNP